MEAKHRRSGGNRLMYGAALISPFSPLLLHQSGAMDMEMGCDRTGSGLSVSSADE